jgi:hypothetical protein
MPDDECPLGQLGCGDPGALRDDRAASGLFVIPADAGISVRR